MGQDSWTYSSVKKNCFSNGPEIRPIRHPTEFYEVLYYYLNDIVTLSREGKDFFCACGKRIAHFIFIYHIYF